MCPSSTSILRALITLPLLLPLACSKPPEMKAVKAVRGDVEALVSGVTAGTVKAEREVDLAFGTVGRVKKLSVRIGDRITKDSVLAELENDDLREILDTAIHDYTRSQELLRSKVLATNENDNAKRAFEIAKSSFEKSLIRAPFDGIVTELNLEVGQLSQITAVIPKPLIRLVDTEPRYIRAEFDEADLPKLSPGVPARVRVSAVKREPFIGTIRQIVPYISSVREQDRTVTIDIEVPTGEILLPVGASADVELLVDTERDAVTIPARAVLGRGDNRYVYILDGKQAKRRVIKVGLYNYDLISVKEGLSEGEPIILPSDSIELVDGLPVEAKFEQWP